MANFFGCGFARVAVKLSILKANGKVEYDHEQRWKKYSNTFQGVHKSRFEVDKNLYTKRSKALELHFKRWKTTPKKSYIEHFSQTNWEKLSEHEKKQHSRANCKACAVHHFSYQSLFPLWGNKTSTVTHEGTSKQINSRILKQSAAGNVKITKKALKSVTKEVYDKINVTFEKTFGVSFAMAQTSVPELNVQVKKSRTELKKEKRNQSKEYKKQIEQQWTENACDAMLATRQTYKQRNEQRMIFCFETPEEAETRARKRKLLEEKGQRKKKRHSPSLKDLEFNKSELLQEVNAMKDGEKVSKQPKISFNSNNSN